MKVVLEKLLRSAKITVSGNSRTGWLMRLLHGIFCLSVLYAQGQALADEMAANPNAYPFDRSQLIAFNPIEKCDSPNQSPVCVAKTVAGCFLPGARHADCIRVGFDIPDKPPEKDPRFDESWPVYDIGSKLWKRTWVELSAVKYYIFTRALRPMAVRTVGPERFKAIPPLDPKLMGTNEVILFQGYDATVSVIQSTSIFVKRTPQGWQATSYVTDYIRHRKDEDIPDYSECTPPMCKYLAKGVAAADVPIDLDYPSYAMPPVFLPDQDLMCGTRPTESPYCEPDIP